MAEVNALIDEASRQLVICNACRYCEGYCPVFRAIETRREFKQGDIFYLANLCHDCRACYYACMYTPPHEFAVNIPQILAQSRMESYRCWSWPSALASAFKNRSVTVALAFVVVALVVVLALAFIPSRNLFAAHQGPGAFYGVALWLRGGVRFWSDTSAFPHETGGMKSTLSALNAAFGLRYLKGGGPGCFYPDERPSGVRRAYHALTFWGFVADFVATTLAFVYQDIFHWMPPYALTSAPVIFGSVGGVALIVGTSGLIYFKVRSDRDPAASGSYGMDYVFLVTLGLTALTGMLLLILRATAAMGSLLILHLACIAALFATAPYGKFVHAVYRTLAIARYEVESKRPHQTASH
jgi:citrate/tricarballylate utilization protein